MEITQKQKNILDLEYNKKLNHQNILLVLLGTISISTWFAEINLGATNSIFIKMGVMLILTLFTIAIVVYYNNEFENIKEKIKSL